jgi:TonB family protein
MWLDRPDTRLQATVAISILLHLMLISQVGFRNAAHSNKNMVLTDVEYIQDYAPPSSGSVVHKVPQPKPKEIVDDKPSTASAPVQPENEPEEAQNQDNANGAPFNPNVDGKLFMPFYAVEQVPVFQSKITPSYPESAQKLGRTSKVILEAYIGIDGLVRMARIVKSGGELFDQAALMALKHSTFMPARVNGKPVPVKILVPYVFSLES